MSKKKSWKEILSNQILKRAEKMSDEDIDKQIFKIQSSTKTSIKSLLPLHERLRMRFAWYYKWHLNPWASKIHGLVVGVWIVTLVVFSGFYVFQSSETKASGGYQLTWTNGAGNGLWSDWQNWDGGQTPLGSDTVYFDGNVSNSDCIIDINDGAGRIDIINGYSGTIRLQSDLTLSQILNVTSGTFDVGGYNLTFYKAAARITISGPTAQVLIGDPGENQGVYVANVDILSGGTLSCNGSCKIGVTYSWTNDGTGIFNPSTGTVTFDGSSLISGGTGVGKAFNNFVHTTGTVIVTTNPVDIDGDFTNSGGIFDAATNNLYVEFAKNWTNSGDATFLTPANGLYFYGTSTITNTSSNVPNLGNITNYSSITLGSDITMTSILGGALNLGAGGYNLTLTGSGTGVNTPLRPTSLDKGTGSTVTYASGANTAIALFNYNNLTLSPASGTPTFTLAGNLTAATSKQITGNLTIGNNATLDVTASNYNIDLGGNWINNGSFTSRSGKVTLNGAALQTITTNGTGAGKTFFNLDVTNSTASPNGIAFAGSTTITGTFTDTTAGSYVKFNSGSTFAFANLNIAGSSDSKITLRSSSDGSAWILNVTQINPSVSYADVKDSNATGGNVISTTSCTDSGGNSGWDFNQAPSDPTLFGPSTVTDGNWHNVNTPTFNFTLADPDAGQQVKYQIQISSDSGFATIVTDFTSALGSQGASSFTVGQATSGGSYNSGNGSAGQVLSDGSYYWQVKTIDSNGVASNFVKANSGEIAFKVDLAAPLSFTPTADPATWTKNNSVNIAFSTTDAGSLIASYSIKIDDGSYVNSVTSPYTLDVSAIPDGSHTVTIKAIDNVTNYRESSVSIQLDKTAPNNFTPSILTTLNGGYTNSNTLNIGSISTSDATSGILNYSIKIDNSTVASGITDPTLNNLDISSFLDGSHNITAVACDNANNCKTSSSVAFNIDRTNPTTNINIDSPNGNLVSDDPSFNWYKTTAPSFTFSETDTGSGISSIFYQWKEVGETAPIPGTGNPGGWLSYTPDTPLQPNDGNTIIYYYGSDIAGNFNNPVLSREFYVDTVVPSVSYVITGGTPNGNNYYIGSAPSISFTGVDASGPVTTLKYQWNPDDPYSDTGYTTYTESLTALEGTNNLYYYAIDEAGNSELSSSQHITLNVSTHTPTASATVTSGTQGNDSWYITALSIRLDCSSETPGVTTQIKYKWDGSLDDQSTIADSGTTISDNLQGRHTLHFSAIDSAGHEINELTEDFYVDTTVPIIDIYASPSSPNGNNSWYKTAPTITFETSNIGASGQKAIYYNWDSELESEYTEPILANQVGTHVLHYRVLDSSGLDSNDGEIDDINRTFKLDNQVPSVSLSPAPNGSYLTSSSAFTITATDPNESNGSGIISISYRWGNTGEFTKINFSAGISKTTDPIPVIENTNSIYYYATDSAGNSSNTLTSATYKLDTLAPSTTVSITGTLGTNDYYKEQSPSFTLTATDGLGSGIGTTYYYWDSGSSTPILFIGNSVTISDRKNSTLYYYSVDKAGHQEETKSVAVNVDTVKPTVSITSSEADILSGWYKDQSPKITLSASDNEGGSNIAITKYRWGDSGQWQDYSSPIYAPEGVNNIYYYSVDNAGNTSEINQSTFELDSNAPDVSSSTPTTTTPINKLDVTFTWTEAQDGNGSGVDYYLISIGSKTGLSDLLPLTNIYKNSYKYTFKDPGTYYARIKAVDKVGHISELSKEGSVIIDLTTPLITLDNLVDGQYITAKEINLSGTAGDQASDLSKVEIQIDNEDWREVTTNDKYLHWSCAWNNYSEGKHTIIARAFDAAGNEKLSTSFSIIVDTVAPTQASDFRVFNTSISSSSVFLIYMDFADSVDDTSGIKSYEIYRDGLKIADVPAIKDPSNKYWTGYPNQPYFLVDESISQKTYTYAVKACDNALNSSSTSEVKIDLTSDQVQAGNLSNLKATPSRIVTENDKTSAIITWQTSNPATTEVSYGESSSYDKTSEIDNTLNQGHTVLIKDLKPQTTYHFQIKSVDTYGKQLSSEDQTFITTTKPKEDSALQLIVKTLQQFFKGLFVSAEEKTIGLINQQDLKAFANNLQLVDTSFPSKGIYQSFLSYPEGSKVTKSSGSSYDNLSATGKNYTIDKNLSNQINYSYRLNEGQPVNRKPSVGDDVALKLEDEEVIKESVLVDDKKGQLMLSWKTNRPAMSQVEFGLDTSYGQKTKEIQTLDQTHTILIEDLTPGSNYHFRAISRNAKGETIASKDVAYKMPEQPKKETPTDLIINSFNKIFTLIKTMFGQD